MQGSNSQAPTGANPGASTDKQLMAGDAALAQSRVELIAAFQDLINEGKVFLKSTAGVSADGVEDARQRFAARLADLKERWDNWSQMARRRSREVALAADDYVHAKPWLSVALVAGTAFVIAALTTRR